MASPQAPQPGEFLLDETDGGSARVESRFVAGTLWLHQGGIANPYDTTKQSLAKHLKAIATDAKSR
jgi:hypothetical protein